MNEQQHSRTHEEREASIAMTSGVPLPTVTTGARAPTSRGRRAGKAMMNAARAGEMMPDSDQVVCIMPFARGSSRSGTSIAYDASNAA